MRLIRDKCSNELIAMKYIKKWRTMEIWSCYMPTQTFASSLITLSSSLCARLRRLGTRTVLGFDLTVNFCRQDLLHGWSNHHLRFAIVHLLYCDSCGGYNIG